MLNIILIHDPEGTNLGFLRAGSTASLRSIAFLATNPVKLKKLGLTPAAFAWRCWKVTEVIHPTVPSFLLLLRSCSSIAIGSLMEGQNSTCGEMTPCSRVNILMLGTGTVIPNYGTTKLGFDACYGRE